METMTAMFGLVPLDEVSSFL